ncbi:FAD-binding oxidoreductase [Paenibacillus sp. 1P07SE]|uniref:FAD-binding oxidoreductase n=1 Tax=Paenibacillus sp. 1P07SE TaxID=3132209 RepID=UPI0039A6CD20
MKQGWQEALKNELPQEILLWDHHSLVKFSNDMHHLSPVLENALAGKLADCIAVPTTLAELDRVIAFAARWEVPLTPRGGGTCNYGQCVPLTGGIVIDVTKLNRVLEIGDGYMRVEPGANMGRMETAAREAGQEMLLLPTTFKKSTLAGFLMGGFGGVGSIAWGTIWDGMVERLTIRTVEMEPRTVVVQGEEIQPYLHSYGTIGIITEIRVALAPKTKWIQYGVTFDDWQTAARFGYELADDDLIRKRLVSVNEWPIPSYFTPFKLPTDRALVFVMLDADHEQRLQVLAARWRGRIDMQLPYDEYHKKLGISDFSFGHYRLWVQKQDPAYTNIQLFLDPERYIEQFEAIKAEFPDLLVHIEFMRKGTRLALMGTPIFRYETEARIQRLKERCIAHGAKVDDPHTYDLEGGGRAYSVDTLWAIKHSNDPLLLLNQEKLSRPKAAQ